MMYVKILKSYCDYFLFVVCLPLTATINSYH